MRSFVLKHGFVVGIAILLVGTALYFLINTLTRDPLVNLTLATIDKGPVEQIVSVGGSVKSNNAADLAFPTMGIVASVAVAEGDEVTAGTLLATLATEQQTAALARAEAEVVIAEAALNNLKNGVRGEARDVTNTSVANARAEIARVTATTNVAVENARRALYSATLIARATDTNEDATPPVISGTYTCETPGTYTIRAYGSSAQSGYSLSVSGLETGTYSMGTTQAVSFGNCGLFAQFNGTDNYRNTTWTIEIPNTSSPNYTTLKNALTAAENNRTSAIATANGALALALRQQTLENAAPVTADIRTAEARVAQARAGVAEIVASLSDRSIIAPFAGTVTKVDILPGETAGSNPVITLLATDGYELVARIPEIDITKIAIDQIAHITFDAAPEEVQEASVSFVSPLPTEINGVSYYEVTLVLRTTPTWLRAGLNADVDIVTASIADTIRVPRRFLTNNDGIYSVQLLTNNTIATSTVSVTMIGNDGFAAISGVTPGATIVAP